MKVNIAQWVVPACVLLCALPVKAQAPADGAWKPIFEHEGVAFSYLFYQKADNENNGVVVRLINTNHYAVSYRFKMVFRDEDDAEAVEAVAGELAARQQKTGSLDGLFWVPFPDGRSVREVGLRGYAVERVDAASEDTVVLDL